MADVTANGVRFHVQRLGQGRPAVLFLHGLVMDNLSSWYFSVANAVAGRREAVLFDLRGHGYSDRPAKGYTLTGFVEDLVELHSALALEPVHVVGNSFGGLLALTFALECPERVESVVSVDGLLPEPGWGAGMVSTLSLQGDARDERIAESFRHWLGRHSERKRNRLARQARALVEESSLLADVAGSHGYTDEQLSGITRPVLALYGQESDQREAGERLARLLPGCTLELLPGCSHSVLWEETVRVRERIVDWVTSGGI